MTAVRPPKEPLAVKQQRCAFARAQRIALANPGDSELAARAQEELNRYYAMKVRVAVERAIEVDGARLSERDRLALAAKLIFYDESAVK